MLRGILYCTRVQQNEICLFKCFYKLISKWLELSQHEFWIALIMRASIGFHVYFLRTWNILLPFYVKDKVIYLRMNLVLFPTPFVDFFPYEFWLFCEFNDLLVSLCFWPLGLLYLLSFRFLFLVVCVVLPFKMLIKFNAKNIYNKIIQN